jgi:hypothetical protein
MMAIKAMTLSKEARSNSLTEAILLLFDNLCDQSIFEVFIDEWSLDDRILPTTWIELKERGLVRQTSVGRYYTLSGAGWLVALKLRSEFDTDAMRQMAGRLCKALKNKIKGRQIEEVVHVDGLAAESGLPAAFIRNAIDSDLIAELFGIKGAGWASFEDRAKFISIPVDFGMEPL